MHVLLCRTLQCRLPLQRPRGCVNVRAMSRAVLAGRRLAESPLVAELRARIQPWADHVTCAAAAAAPPEQLIQTLHR